MRSGSRAEERGQALELYRRCFAIIDIDVHFKRDQFELECTIRDSGFIGLTGPNGSGKSTLLRILTGVEFPDSGRIIVDNSDVTDLPINERRIVYLNPDTYFGHADVDRHLKWGIGERGSRLDIGDLKKSLGINYSGRVSRLSLGQRARVVLGTAILAEPDVILIDELFANISSRDGVVNYTRELSKQLQMDIIFVSQDPADLEKADSVYYMDSGRVSRKV